MLTITLLHAIATNLSSLEGKQIEIEKIVAVHGGSINKAYCLVTPGKKYFVKVNSLSRFPAMFEQEKGALSLLQSLSKLRIPEPLFNGSFEDEASLVMEYIEGTKAQANFWEEFGRGLAEIHQISSVNGFGLEQDNYIGSLHQRNGWKTNWIDFFIKNRLQAQEKMAIDAGLIDLSLTNSMDKLYGKLKGIFPVENSSLLHGDLWSGNFMVGSNGEAVIMDPAVYYGNREMDIAMTHLFGGFNAKFYGAYQEHFPLKENWEERIEICNLYPLLVHVNLFGESYAQRLKTIVNRFV